MAMLVLAHRGYHAELPENTLGAFDAAVRLGADGVETDVQVTRDGTPILFHDRLIQGREVATLTHAELAEMAGYEVPTLAAALDAFPNILWNLEIKMPTDPEPILTVLRRYRDRRQMLVSSFWHPVAVRAGRELGVECGLLTAHRPLSLTGLLTGAFPARPAMIWNYESVDAELIDQTRMRGAWSYVYGVQTPADHARAAAWNLAGVITDDPGLMQPFQPSLLARGARSQGAC